MVFLLDATARQALIRKRSTDRVRHRPSITGPSQTHAIRPAGRTAGTVRGLAPVLVLAAGLASSSAMPAVAADTATAARAAGGSEARMVVARAESRATGSTSARRGSATAEASRDGPRPMVAIVSIANQRIDVFDGDGKLHTSRVSTGRSGKATPTGVFSILQRRRYHTSNIYSGAPMPFMQRLTWSGIALHEGSLPGYPASAGCIRLPGSFARTFWDIGKIGMSVVVSPTGVSPQPIQHERLPAPTLKQPTRSAELVRVASAGDEPAASGPVRALTPYEVAQARLARATADRTTSSKAVKPAYDLATQKSAEARQAAEALKASAGILADAKEHLEFESFGMATVQTEEAEAQILDRIRRAQAGVAAALEAHEKLVVAEQTASDEAFAAARAAREARSAAEAAEEELREARHGVEPMSVFVSRQTGKIYVRQGFQELLEETITITDPDRPLGTHFYLAMDETSDGRDVRWATVTVPTSGGRRASGPHSDPEDALGRIDFPAEVKSLLADHLWPGATLIVSDFGLGETGKGTGFVILTR